MCLGRFDTTVWDKLEFDEVGEWDTSIETVVAFFFFFFFKERESSGAEEERES